MRTRGFRPTSLLRRAGATAFAIGATIALGAPLQAMADSPSTATARTPAFMIASTPAGVAAGTGSGSGFCPSVSGAVGGRTVWASNIGAAFDNVFACGPTENTGWSNDPFETDFQCVELSTRFMWDAWGLRAAPGNGGVFVANNHARFPSIPVGTPGVGSLPAPGDVASLAGGALNPNADSSGHTVVVTDVSHVNLTTGNGYIGIMEENAGGNGWGRITVTNWAEAYGAPNWSNGLYWYPQVSWLELTTPTPTPPPAPSVALSDSKVCTSCAAPLQYHGGQVMGPAATTTQNSVSSIFWSTGTAPTAGYRDLVDGYLSNVASSPSTANVFSVDAQYYEVDTGTQNAVGGWSAFGGQFPDTSSLPSSGCTPDPGYAACLTDAQLQNEIARVIGSQGTPPPTDLAHLYLLFLPPGVESCASPGSCSSAAFCGYHGSYAVQAGTVLYATVPYPTDGGCTSGQAPNGDRFADSAIDTVSRELSEALTDPLGSAWSDAGGNEISALCSNQYGTPQGSADPANPQTSLYNQVIGSGRYYTQEEFSNAAYAATGHGCVQGTGQAAPAPANQLATTASPAQVPNDNAATSAINVTVTTPQHTPAAGDRVHFTVFTRSGTCGAVSPTEVSTDTTGHALTTFTASAADASCSVVATESASGATNRTTVEQGVSGVYRPLTPFRIADTRVDSGRSLQGQSLGPAQADTLQVAGVDGVPADATAVVINVVATNATAQSFLTVYPAGATLPLSSNLDFNAGQTVANLVTVPLGANGAVRIYNHAGTADAVVDLEGYMEPEAGPAGLYNPLVPHRIADTRPGSGQPESGSTLGPDSTLLVQVDGAGGVPATGVSAVVLNLTVSDTTASSFLTLYPTAVTRPLTSTMNFGPGQVVPNRVIVPVGSDGKLAIYNFAGSADVIVDVGGWFADGSDPNATGFRFTPLAPTRVADTRAGSAEPLSGRTLGPAGSALATVVATAGLPAQAVGVAANVTVAGATAPSFLTVYPNGTSTPTSSDLNWVGGQITSNMLVAGVGSNDGALALFNHVGQVDVIVDVFGYWS